MKNFQHQRFYLIDTMRAVMIVIVLSHAWDGHHIDDLFERLPTSIQFVFEHGHLAVGLFFVISGFVIMHHLADREIDASLSWRFLLRRSVRLDPPYWAAMALTISFAWLSYTLVAGKSPPDFSVPQIASHFIYAQTLLGYAHLDLAYWTLCLEFQFYILFVLILLAGGGSPIHPEGRFTRIVLIATSMVTLLWPLHLGPPVLRGLLLPRAYMFLLGVNAYWAFRSPTIRPWFVAYALLLTIGGIYDGDDYAGFCATSSLFILAMALGDKLQTTKNWTVLQLLGKISYTVYLTHNPITAAVFRIGYMITGRSVATEFFWLVVDMLACVAFGYLLCLAIERPSIELSRKIKLND